MQSVEGWETHVCPYHLANAFLAMAQSFAEQFSYGPATSSVHEALPSEEDRYIAETSRPEHERVDVSSSGKPSRRVHPGLLEPGVVCGLLFFGRLGFCPKLLVGVALGQW